jgi:hypothetical protein
MLEVSASSISELETASALCRLLICWQPFIPTQSRDSEPPLPDLAKLTTLSGISAGHFAPCLLAMPLDTAVVHPRSTRHAGMQLPPSAQLGIPSNDKSAARHHVAISLAPFLDQISGRGHLFYSRPSNTTDQYHLLSLDEWSDTVREASSMEWIAQQASLVDAASNYNHPEFELRSTRAYCGYKA